MIIALLWAWQGIYVSTPNEEKVGKFVVLKGEGLSQISEKLEDENWIENKYLFEIYAHATRKSSLLKAGEYELKGSMTIPLILEKFASGDAVKEEVIIIEGWNLRDIGSYLEERKLFQSEEFLDMVGFPAVDHSRRGKFPKDFSDDFSFLRSKPEKVSLEGFLFPDTYQVREDIAVEELVVKMLANFDKRIGDSLRVQMREQDRSMFEVVTMASLLEKEVRTPENKRLVSGILWKRLENQIPLQVDATVNYVTGKKTTKVSKKETEIDSQFNTYKYKGLPLGPICNPGLESIKAALNPQKSDYWYYLSTSEKTYFSKTLREHNIKKAKYLR